MRSMRRCVRPQGHGTRKYAGKVACAVAYQRHHFTVEGSQYQFSNLTVGNRFAGFRIDDFNQIAIFPKVHAVLLGTLKGNAGTVHFGHAETVVGFDTQYPLNFPALFVRMRFGSDDEGFQSSRCRIDTFFLKYFRQAYGITGNGMQGGGSEVRDELDLPLAVTGSGGYGQCAQAFGSVLKT